MTASVQQSPLPSRHAVRTLVEGLVGRDVSLEDGTPIASNTGTVVAVYVGDGLATQAIAIVDLAGAAWFGGALGMLPRGGVEDAVAAKELPQVLSENCYEVLNVLASVFNEPDAPHVRLHAVYGPDDTVPGDVAALAGQATSRMDVRLRITGYGPADVSVIVC